MNRKVSRNPRRHEAIIDPEILLEAIRDAKAMRGRHGHRPLAAMDGEPVLQEFLLGALLETAGLAALHGAPPPVVRGMNAETRFLLTVTFEAVSRAHRRLYEDLLPQTDTQAADTAEPGPAAPGSPSGSADPQSAGTPPAVRPVPGTEGTPAPPARDKEDAP